MTVADLKKMLADAPDDMSVLIPMTGEFDGYFKHPCVEESVISHLSEDENGEDSPMDAFMLVPCGFFKEHEGVPVELN